MDGQEAQSCQSDAAAAAEIEGQESPGIRPLLDGITGSMKVFAIAAMFLGPLAAMAVVCWLRDNAEFSSSSGQVIMVLVFCMSIYSFITGYVIFSGSGRGRDIALLFLVLVLLLGEIICLIADRGFLVWFALGMLCIRVLGRNPKCGKSTNNRNVSIHAPLSTRGRRAWKVWGIVAAAANLVVLVHCLTAPNFLIKSGYRLIEDKEAAFSVEVEREVFRITAPYHTTYIDDEIRIQDETVTVLSFAEIGRRNSILVVYNIGYYQPEEESKSFIDAIGFSKFAGYIGDLARNGENSYMVTQNEYSIVTVTSSNYAENGRKVVVNNYEAFVLARNRLLVMNMVVAGNAGNNSEQSFLHWIEEIRQINEGIRV